MNRALKITALVLALSTPVLAGTSSSFPEPGDEKEKAASASPNVSRTKSMGVAIYRSINSAKMNLMIENYIEVPLYVSLRDEKNEVLHTEKVSKRLKKYWRKFDMETMKDGLYTFEISDGLNKVTKSFRLETQKVETKEPGRFVSLLN
ncbi:hypothetical protein [Larkinella arboricola]|uniref:Secreted protein (Por secretion system target) n=1 Tax=Larkinella arboricola TaxID=643671 RepID=A0A327WLL3_LARAB|nr:hypothetical protein [Larkinella arboricola]RAJ92175.1 hypothetical protein LX87_05142 [Larkinella arboricola]